MLSLLRDMLKKYRRYVTREIDGMASENIAADACGQNRLACSIRDLINRHVMEEKWLLAPSLRTGYQWLDVVTRSGRPVLNARVKTIARMALELASPEMQRSGVALLHGVREELLVDTILSARRRRKEDIQSLVSQLVSELIDDLINWQYLGVSTKP